ncbi:MAG: DUF3313 domain-containing protein [Steroidobacteraceae bacterium]
MNRSIAKTAAVLLAALFGMSLATQAAAQDSGFLKDYSQLAPEKDALGVERRVWISPKLTRDNYQKILLEQVTFYPQPQPSDKVSMDTLNQIRSYGDNALRTALATVAPLVDQPGPGVLRVRVAMTGASVQGAKLEPYQLIPAAFVLTMAARAAGASHNSAQLAVESEGTDSVTGELLFEVVRQAQGVQLQSNEDLTVQMVEPNIDEWVSSAQQVLSRRMKAAGQ